MLRSSVLLLVAALGLFLVVFRSPPPWRLHPGRAGDERSLQDFHPRELSKGIPFRWSQPGSRLVLHGVGSQPARLVLELDSSLAPLRVAVMADRQVLATLQVVPGPHTYEVPLTLDSVRSAFEPLTLELLCDQYFPARDGRRLGVKVTALGVVPDATRPGSWAAPLARSAILTWTLGVLTAALARLDRLLFRTRPGASRRVSAIVAMIALALALAAHRDPYWLAWALPFMPIILGLLSAALLLPIRSRPAALEPPPEDPKPPTMARATSSLLLGTLVVLAIGLRFHRIQELPWAMWHDEARHALVALQILRDSDYRPVYVPSVQLPALGLYPFTLALELWGIHPWSLRPVTALAGALTVLPLYALARRLTHSTRVALIAGFFLAVSSWHLSISRLSFPTVFDPLLTLTALWMLLRGLEGRSVTSRACWLAGAGLCVGTALQTYHTGRVAPLVAALLVFLAPKPEGWRARALLPLALGFGVCAAPLFVFALHHPDAFNRRVSEVFLLSHAQENALAPLAALDASVGRHLLMFNVKGDENGRHHAPGRPLLDLVTGLGFLAGLTVLVRQRERWESRFVLGALVLFALPSVLAVDGPHAMRSIGDAAFACLIAGIGWLEIARRTGRLRAVLLGALAMALGLNVWIYFVAMPVDPRVWKAFYPVQTQMGVFVRSLAERRHTTRLADLFVPDSVATNEVFIYLTHGLSLERFAERELSRPPEPDALFVLSGYSYEAQALALASYLGDEPAPLLLGPPFPGLAAPSFVLYESRSP